MAAGVATCAAALVALGAAAAPLATAAAPLVTAATPGTALVSGTSGGSVFTPPAPIPAPSAPVVAVVSTSSSQGAWEAASNGAVYASGNAPTLGSMAGRALHAPIVGMAATPTGNGYWLVASDGGIFTFGAARFHGSTGAASIDVTSIAAEDRGNGYLWCDAAGLCQGASANAVVSGHAYVPPAEPPANVPMEPTFQEPVAGATPGPCWSMSGTTQVPAFTRPACLSAEVRATDHARAAEGLPAMRLPTDFATLTPQEQLFVLTDIERVSRGEQPVLGLSALLDGAARTGAQRNADPSFSVLKTLPTYDGAGSNWGASRSSLQVDYYWLYLDGWDGSSTSNADCTSPTSTGCWAHRANILKPSQAMVMGIGFVADHWNGYNSYAEFLVTLRSAASAPAMYYTWADAVAAGAAG